MRYCFLINKPQRFAYSDASATGCGSVITLNEDCVCHKLWEPSERSKSSTWRELAAIDFSLESFAPILEGSLVKWFTDSQTAARIIEVGSMKLGLHRLAIKIFQFCAEHSIRLEVQWIPRTENEKADYISRLLDFDDWQITHDLFLSLEELWGPHSGGWTRSAKHDGANDRFELSCNEPSYCADLEEQVRNQLQELEITKMEVSPILVV